MKIRTLFAIVVVAVLGLALQGCTAIGAGLGYGLGGPKGAIAGGLVGAGADVLAVTSIFRSAKDRERAEAAARAEAEALAKGIEDCEYTKRREYQQGALVVNREVENCRARTRRVQYPGDNTHVSPPPSVTYEPTGGVRMEPYTQQPAPTVPVPVPPTMHPVAPPSSMGVPDPGYSTAAGSRTPSYGGRAMPQQQIGVERAPRQ